MSLKFNVSGSVSENHASTDNTQIPSVKVCIHFLADPVYHIAECDNSVLEEKGGL
jgi:hypothetical protein